MKQYVTGFLFTSDLSRVALIRKTHPEFQNGKLNGIGGKIEQCESPIQAMIREFEEEAGLHVERWKRFCILQGTDHEGNEFCVHFFYTVYFFLSLKSQTEEEIEIINVKDIHAQHTLGNIPWLLHMAICMEGFNTDELIVNETRQRIYR